MLVLSATWRNPYLRKLIDQERFEFLLGRTIIFLRKLSPISPTCKLDCSILEKIQRVLFGTPPAEKPPYSKTNRNAHRDSHIRTAHDRKAHTLDKARRQQIADNKLCKGELARQVLRLLESAETWSTAAKLANGRTSVSTRCASPYQRTPDVGGGYTPTLSRRVGPEGFVRVFMPLQLISLPTWPGMSTSGSPLVYERTPLSGGGLRLFRYQLEADSLVFA